MAKAKMFGSMEADGKKIPVSAGPIMKATPKKSSVSKAKKAFSPVKFKNAQKKVFGM